MEAMDVKKDIINRLKTIKGHINGIEKMIEEDKGCHEVLVQITAIKASIEKVGLLIIEENSKECLMKDHVTNEEIEDIIKNIIKFMK
ncbi:metal-sensitive transcriptional regulator [Alkaliphilus serpentinus]|uniref:Metal-sensitive transcriptional regulator n=1 Tax=Alkaliphilus serpentinus TaxID=1482731 RepID=A0A833HP61_9FIRM|nr:metal-sensitive transcriptional regulator [Alkaliphilus serpentinus]KAB3530268.1 metal-sensitive transcriptional regulator [Alkaliphilus serpentinus]